jgi:hypothetical protein
MNENLTAIPVFSARVVLGICFAPLGRTVAVPCDTVGHVTLCDFR